MPNEELLKEILAQMKSMNHNLSNVQSDVSTLKGDVSTLKSDVSTLKGDVSTLKGDVSTLKSEVADIKATMVTKDEFMHAIGEQQQDVMKLLELTNKKVDRIESDIKNVRRDIRTIEAVTAKNWNDILDLKEAN